MDSLIFCVQRTFLGLTLCYGKCNKYVHYQWQSWSLPREGAKLLRQLHVSLQNMDAIFVHRGSSEGK